MDKLTSALSRPRKKPHASHAGLAIPDLNMDELNNHLKQIAYEMIRSGAPEREAELSKMWETYSPEFIYSDDKPNFVLEAGAYGSLRLTDRTLRLIWIFGHIAWKTLYLYSGLIHVYSSSDADFDVGNSERSRTGAPEF